MLMISTRIIISSVFFFVGACSHTNNLTFIGSVPINLKTPSSEDVLIHNAKSNNGCAFAGTWEFRIEENKASIGGWIVLEVIPKIATEAHSNASIRGVIDWSLSNSRVWGSYKEIGSFYIYDRLGSAKRSIFTYAYLVEEDGDLTRLLVKLDLDEDGLKADFAFVNSIHGDWRGGRARKVQTGICGKTVRFIDVVKAKLERKSGAHFAP